jgi:hypothetical protein
LACDVTLLSQGLLGAAVRFLMIPGLASSSIPEETPGQTRGSKKILVAEWQIRLDARHIGLMHEPGLRHMALLLGALAGKKVATTTLGELDFAGSGDLEPLGHGLACFAAGD